MAAIWKTTFLNTFSLTHWGRVTHICVSELTYTGSDNGLSPGRRQAIIWNNAGLLLIEPLGTNFSEILIAIITFSFKKTRLKVSSAKWRPYCLGLNVLMKILMSLNGNIFGVAGPLCGEFTGHRLIPLTKASDAELWCFLWSALE